MARRVFSYPPGLVRKYIPAPFKNRGDPEPITVWVKSPTEAEKRLAAAEGQTTKIRMPKGLSDSSGTTIEIAGAAKEEQMRELLSRFVTKVDNYLAADGHAIKDGADLFVNGDSPVVEDVFTEIMQCLSLTDGEKKLWRAPLSSLLVATQASAGIVASASMPESSTNATAPEISGPSSST